jgi:molybdate transport system regulatory protein
VTRAKADKPKTRGIRLRIIFEPGIMLGPGRADLLEGIEDTGSIAAAGRRMGMSYKRAWTLVETMNTQFPEPLVTGGKGGAGGGGSGLTELGKDVLVRYRRMLKRTEAAIKPDRDAIEKTCRDIAKRK